MDKQNTKAPKKNLYQTLGLEPNATVKEIQKAHNSLLKMYHPQVNKAPSALLKYMAIEKAYKVLSDPKSKSEYDIKNFGGQNKPSVSVSEPKEAPVKSELKVKKAKVETVIKAEEPKAEVVTKPSEPKAEKAKIKEPKTETKVKEKEPKIEKVKTERLVEKIDDGKKVKETSKTEMVASASSLVEPVKTEESKVEEPIKNDIQPIKEAEVKPEETKPIVDKEPVKADDSSKTENLIASELESVTTKEEEKGKKSVENKGEEKKEIKKLKKLKKDEDDDDDDKLVPIIILPRKRGKTPITNKTDLEILKEKQRKKERLKRVAFLLLAILFFLSTIMSVIQVEERSIWSWIFNPSGVIEQGPPEGGDDDDYTQLDADEQRITINALITFSSYTGNGNIRIYNHRTNVVYQKINLRVRFGADAEGVGPIIYTNPTNIFGTPILLKPDQSITSDRMNALGRSMGGNTAYEEARTYGEQRYLTKYGSIPSGYDIYAVVAEFQAYNSSSKLLGQTNAEIFIFIKI